MPLAMSLGVDNIEHRKNAVDHETAAIWSELKSFGGVERKIDVADLVFISVRDTEEAEDYFILKKTSNNLTYRMFAVEELKRFLMRR